MTPEQLKASILQYAIQGKLVEQRPEEGTGEELYQQIQAEKRRLIQEKKIKKEKPLAEISENEIPFDIPESWKWCRLSSLTYNWGQKTPDKRFCYIDVGSINNISHTLNVENTVVEAKDASSRAKKIVQKGDVLFATIRPYLKNICIIDRDFPYEALSIAGMKVARICEAGSILQVCIGGSISKVAMTKQRVTFNQQINSITPFCCDNRYIYYVMMSFYFSKTMKEKAGGTATPK